ncbi:hypothetical protein [Hymenobacter persicinus]|uniref:Uncharacterized protein n=1 Tax=Hymenobacter persicinus TaxID=2025506 RepID=A0A4Q5L7V8_9BACT|nr:hypothetical protein [Hymenobacter persicinus]RYU77674.1 hypothetical protein EWM57_17265 [Hymenobacter persicinus]
MDEGGLLRERNALWTQLGERLVSDEEARRIKEQQKLFDDADTKIAKLTGLEVDYADQVQTIVADRDLALRDLAAKHAEEEEKRRLDEIDRQIQLSQAEEQEQLAALELKLANGVTNEWDYQNAVFAVKQAAHDRELALIREKAGAETAEYKKANADKLRDEADYKAKKKKLDDDQAKAETIIQAFKKVMGQQELDFLGAALGKKSVIYKLALAAQKAAAIAEIEINLQKQIQDAFTTGAKIQGLFPPVSIPLGVAYTAAAIGGAVVNAGLSTAKIAGFRAGGRTGGGTPSLEVAGLQVAANGKLLDGEGFAVAGLVHENEYVIPEWMRADPQVAQMEQWLEARRLRGYAQGGATTEGGSQVPVGELAGADSGEVVQLLRQLIADNRSNAEKMDTWARELKVVQKLHEFDQEYAAWKKVNNGGING